MMREPRVIGSGKLSGFHLDFLTTNILRLYFGSGRCEVVPKRMLVVQRFSELLMFNELFALRIDPSYD